MRHYPFLIGNEWIDSENRFEVRNPYDNKVIATVARPDREQCLASVNTAMKAFEMTRNLPSHHRRDILRKTAEGIGKRSGDLARTLAIEAGKPIRDARGEVSRAITTFTLAAEEATRIHGELLPLDISESAGDRFAVTRRFPIGPILGIAPFNFPMNLVAHKVAPCIATGNTMILKPASATPLSSLLLGEILLEAGMPEGMVSILPCTGSDASFLVGHDLIKMVTFTGSAEVGWMLKTRAGKKRVCLELGGNAAAVVDADADVDYAVSRCVLGSFSYAGQICISVQRIYIHRNVYKEFTEKFLVAVQKIRMGDPLEEETDVGPMIDEISLEKTEDRVRKAAGRGVTILTGGKRRGNFFEPTVLVGCSEKDQICAEEIFAPVVILFEFTDYEETLDAVNRSRFGLQAGVFTKDMSKVWQAFNRIETGGVIIDDIPTVRVDSMPYGGVKDSGFGREGLRYAIEEMTEIKVLVMRNCR